MDSPRGNCSRRLHHLAARRERPVSLVPGVLRGRAPAVCSVQVSVDKQCGHTGRLLTGKCGQTPGVPPLADVKDVACSQGGLVAPAGRGCPGPLSARSFLKSTVPRHSASVGLTRLVHLPSPKDLPPGPGRELTLPYGGPAILGDLLK